MLNRCISALLAAGLTLIVCVGVVLAQERIRLGRFDDFSGQAKVKEVGATGTYVQLQDSWVNQGVYKGDELVTGEDSYMRFLIETTKVELHSNTHVIMDQSEEGLYVVNVTRGEITAHIKTDVIQLGVLNQTIYGKGTTVNIKIKPNKNIIIKALAGAPYIDNEYGATIVVPEQQTVTISYDRLKREYTFLPHTSNTIDLGVLPKGERVPIEITVGKEYVILEDGRGTLQETVEEKGVIPTPRKPKPEKIFGVNAIVRYDWFESYKELAWYRGKKETFEASRANVRIGTKFSFAEVRLGVDAVKENHNPLEDMWLRLFIPKYENVLNFKVGQMQVPFGAQCQTYPEDLLALEYSQAVQYAFASVQGRADTQYPDLEEYVANLDYLYDVGFQVYGEFEFFSGFRFLYSAGLFNGEKRVTLEQNESKAGAGRLAVILGDVLTIGGSGYDGELWLPMREGYTGTIWPRRYNSISRRRNGIDIRIDAGKFVLQGEYIWAEDNLRTVTQIPGMYPGELGTGAAYNVTEGYYLEAGFNLGLVKESWDKFTIIAKVDLLDPPKDSYVVNPKSTHSHSKSILYAFGAVWKITDNVKLTALFSVLDMDRERYKPASDPLLEKGDIDQRAIFQFTMSF
jgi:hypothetical protein